MSVCRPEPSTANRTPTTLGGPTGHPQPFRRWPAGGRPVSDDDLATVVGLLDDEHARTILRATSVKPRTASELAEECDASRQTVYRRLGPLEDAGLVAGRSQLREDGHHDTVYRATFDSLSVALRDGDFEFDVTLRDADSGGPGTDAADELTDLWRKF